MPVKRGRRRGGVSSEMLTVEHTGWGDSRSTVHGAESHERVTYIVC